MSSTIDFLIGFVALGYFLMISIATKQHFVSGKYPLGMHIISSVSLVGLFTFLYHTFWRNLDFPAISLALICLAFALFIWSAVHSREKNLSLAFSGEMKIDGIITSGPWKYIRHPFYASYITFWLACAIGTTHPASIIVFAGLLFIYAYSAIREEGALTQGQFGDAYLNYRKKAGFFLPKFVSRN